MESESRAYRTGMLVVKSSDYDLINSQIKRLKEKFESSFEQVALYNS